MEKTYNTKRKLNGFPAPEMCEESFVARDMEFAPRVGGSNCWHDQTLIFSEESCQLSVGRNLGL